MQRNEYSPPPRFDIDHRTAVMIAYQNCLNSFAFSEMTSASEMRPDYGGITRSMAQSQVTVTRFAYNLAVLDGLLEDEKDDSFKVAKEPNSMVDVFKTAKGPVQNIEPQVLFAYWNRVDKFLRQKNLYAIDKIQKGHL